jgi:hypothetical protein
MNENTTRTVGGQPDNTNGQTHGFYTAKKRAMQATRGEVDARTTEGKEVLADRKAFKDQCGRKNYRLKRRKLWQIAERLQRVLNRLDPIIFTRSSLINKRRNVVMPMALDYVRIVTAYGEAINKAFDGLPDTKPTADPMDKLRRKVKRQTRQNANGAGGSTTATGEVANV